MKEILRMRRDGTTAEFNVINVAEAIRSCWRQFETYKQKQQNQPKEIRLYYLQKQRSALRTFVKLARLAKFLKFFILFVSKAQKTIIPKLQTLTTISYIHTLSRP